MFVIDIKILTSCLVHYKIKIINYNILRLITVILIKIHFKLFYVYAYDLDFS